MDLNVPFQNKKSQMLEDRYTEIERENRILLEKITNIMHKPILSNLLKSTPYLAKIRSKSSILPIYNHNSRKKYLLKITAENQMILDRIKKKQPLYDTKKILKDTSKHFVLL
jgi:hypothetical protein